MTLHIDMIEPDILAAERPPGQHITWPEIEWPPHEPTMVMGCGTSDPSKPNGTYSVEYAYEPGNNVQSLLSDDAKHVITVMSIGGEPKAWIEWDKGQLGGLIAGLQKLYVEMPPLVEFVGGGTGAPGDGGAMTIPANSKLQTWVTAEGTNLHWPPFAVAKPKPGRWRVVAATLAEAALVFFAVMGVIYFAKILLP